MFKDRVSRITNDHTILSHQSDEPMKTPTQMTPAEWSGTVQQSRMYGSCYIRVADRGGLTARGVSFSWCYYGRSYQGGGHKMKAYAHDQAGKIVRTKMLRALFR